jgi:cytochrome bd-type quinol oxidase subunit 2
MTARPTLRQRKTFALIRIVAGLVAAFYLGYVVVANLLAGVPFDNTLRFSALIALVGLGYAGWYLRDLSAVAREERGEGQ